MARFDRRIGSLEEFADAQAAIGRLDQVRRIRRVSNETQLRIGEHLIVDTDAVGDVVYIRLPAYSPGSVGIESRVAVRGSGSAIITPPQGMRINGTLDNNQTATSSSAVAILMEDADNYFSLKQAVDTDTDTDTGMIYVNRGDFSSWDYTATNFTASASVYYDLDLSSIVGSQRALVHFRCQLQGTTVGDIFALRTPDVSATNRNAAIASVYVANRTDEKTDLWAETNSTGVIEYRRDTTVGTVNLIIRGWFENV